MHGRGGDTAFNHLSNITVLAPSLPPHCCLSLCWCYMQVNSTSSAYHVITISTATIPPLFPTLPVLELASLDNTLCLILIRLARPKKVSATVKLCLWGGDCKAKCLRSFSHAKSYRIFFRFTPKLSDQVVVITEESDFYTRHCRNKLHDSKKGKTGICKSVVIATVVAIGDVIKNGFHCIIKYVIAKIEIPLYFRPKQIYSRIKTEKKLYPL